MSVSDSPAAMAARARPPAEGGRVQGKSEGALRERARSGRPRRNTAGALATAEPSRTAGSAVRSGDMSRTDTSRGVGDRAFTAP
jgi:hypothetical protein